MFRGCGFGCREVTPRVCWGSGGWCCGCVKMEKKKDPASGGSTRGMSGRSRTTRLLGTVAYWTPGIVLPAGTRVNYAKCGVGCRVEWWNGLWCGWGCAGWGLEAGMKKPTLVRGLYAGSVCIGLVGLDGVVEARWAVEVEDTVEVVVHGADIGVDDIRVCVGAVAGSAGEGVHCWGGVGADGADVAGVLVG